MTTRWTAADLAAHLAKKEKAKTPKYRNRKTVVDDIEFDSEREANRYVVLRDQERIGLIQNLKRQYVFAIIIDGVRICDYVADFVCDRSGHRVIEDAKGMKTDLYRIKKKLMKAVHGIQIFES